MTGFELIAEQRARERNLPWPFVKNLITAESNFNPLAVSSAGARGLMQLMPMTARGYGVTDPQALFDPAVNIDVGTRHLARLMQRYEGDPDQLPKVAAAYNAGEGRVPRGQPLASFFSQLPRETRNYVPKVAGPIVGASSTAPALFGPPISPPRQTELRQGTSPRLLESLYNYVFGTENEGLPPAKTWPGPELGLPPEQLSTGDLASMGLLALSGMGAAAPTVGRALPALLPPLTMRNLGDIAMGYMGGEAGRKVGEAVGGEVGGNIGRGIGSALSFPYLSPAGTVLKSDLVDIPPIGPLEGTTVLTRKGTAKPMVHGTRSAFPELQLEYNKDSDALLYGPGHYFTSATNVAEGYAGKAQLSHEKLARQLEEKATQAEKKAWKGRTALREFLTPDERAQYDTIDWNNSRWRERFNEITDSAVKRHITEETADSMTLDPAFDRAFVSAQEHTARSKEFRRKASQYKDKIAELPEQVPNIRPAYLNIKNPFNIDKSPTNEDLRRIGDAIEQNRSIFTDLPNWIRKGKEDHLGNFVAELRAGGRRRAKELYKTLEDHLGSKANVNKVLEDAGFDGITHIDQFVPGRSGPKYPMPMKHRVYIAFRDDQVVPYFNPQFSEKQAKHEWLKKQKQAKTREWQQYLTASRRAPR